MHERAIKRQGFLKAKKKAGALLRLCVLLLLETVLVLELLNTAASVSKLLLACKERVAFRADVYSHLCLIGESHECISTCASNFTFLITRMDSFLHVGTSFYNILKRFEPPLQATARVVYHPKQVIARVFIIYFFPDLLFSGFCAAPDFEDQYVEYQQICSRKT